MYRRGTEMGRISMATRDELEGTLAGRYAASNRKERDRILDEFAAVSGLHRKHAMRLLRAGRPGHRSGLRRARRLYNDAVREALIVIWEASSQAAQSGTHSTPSCRGTGRQAGEHPTESQIPMAKPQRHAVSIGKQVKIDLRSQTRLGPLGFRASAEVDQGGLSVWSKVCWVVRIVRE